MITSALIHFINDKKEEYKKNTPSSSQKDMIYNLTKIYWNMSSIEKQNYKNLEK